MTKEQSEFLKQIHTEFTKLALNKRASWHDLSYKAQVDYLRNHKKSKRRLTKRPGEGGRSIVIESLDVPETLLTDDFFDSFNKFSPQVARSNRIPTGANDCNDNSLYQHDAVWIKTKDDVKKAKVLGEHFILDDDSSIAIKDVAKKDVIRLTDWLIDNFSEESNNKIVRRFKRIHPELLHSKEDLIEKSEKWMLPRSMWGLIILNNKDLVRLWAGQDGLVHKYGLQFDDDKNWDEAINELIKKMPPNIANKLYDEYSQLFPEKEVFELTKLSENRPKTALINLINKMPEIVIGAAIGAAIKLLLGK